MDKVQDPELIITGSLTAAYAVFVRSVLAMGALPLSGHSRYSLQNTAGQNANQRGESVRQTGAVVCDN